MKRKIISFFALLALMCFFAGGVFAKTFRGEDDWHVEFTPEAKMVSTFSTADMDDLILGMQPGDDAIITLKLKNEHRETTNWYMTNKVLSSLEDRSKTASGGAYTYTLTYVGMDGEEDVLFDSDTVGGDDSQNPTGTKGATGLHQATGALEEYFFLDTLEPGQGGTLTLKVALDGESQANNYQDTRAALQMNFAVELNRTGTTRNDTSVWRPVQTGDETNLMLWSGVMLGCGIAALVLGIIVLRRNRRNREDEDE